MEKTAILQSDRPDIGELLTMSFIGKKEIAFRAAWMLEQIMVSQPDKFAPHVSRLLELLPEQKNHSAMRHYTKIIALLTAKNADPIYQALCKETDFEPVVAVLFDRLLDPHVLVASKVHSMQALANLAPRFGWIKDDLLETISYLTDLESIAFFARARMVRKQLAKLK